MNVGQPHPSFQKDIEINVTEGYWVAGAFILGAMAIMLFVCALSKLNHPDDSTVFAPLIATALPGILIALFFILSVSTVRISPSTQQAVFENGLRPFIKRRTENISGEKRFAIRAIRGSKGGRFVVVDLELTGGRKFPVLRNVTPSKFDALAEEAVRAGIPLVVVGPSHSLPSWFAQRIGRFRIERSS